MGNHRRFAVFVLAGAAMIIVACFSQGSALAANTGAAATPPAGDDAVNIHALPLGDGRYLTGPRIGYVYACQSRFRGGGAAHAGPWIHGATWDLSQKFAVEGRIRWPEAQFSITASTNIRIVAGNGLPVDAVTGIFPIRSDDPAYKIDRNPNHIEPWNLRLVLPLSPTIAATPSCVPGGVIGVALNGVTIFDALDAAGRDAAAHEVQGVCNGHPERHGIYHYHGPSPCMPHVDKNAALVGYAIDGFGIYSPYDSNGRELTDASLDRCHGTTTPVLWNGKVQPVYHYVLTREFPYTVGCFRGTPIRPQMMTPGVSDGARPLSSAGYRRPPPRAIAACTDITAGDRCSFFGRNGAPVSGVCRTTPQGVFACVPIMGPP